MTSKHPNFRSIEEEAQYWKKLAHEYKDSFEQTREELEEFQMSSRELETELETQLEQLDTRCTDLRQQVNRLAIENQSLKERLGKEKNDFCSQLTSLHAELTGIKTNKESLVGYIRELEQTNDDLERAKRVTVASLEDFESRLNHAIERNVFLESELDDKDSLRETVQRLKDEARDLRQEVNIQKREDEIPDNDVAMKIQQQKLQLDKKIISPLIDSNKLITENQINSDSLNQKASNKCLNNIHAINGNVSMPPSARVSALNIVGDLLRKVGALESRVASCRSTLVKENQRPISLPSSGNHNAR